MTASPAGHIALNQRSIASWEIFTPVPCVSPSTLTAELKSLRDLIAATHASVSAALPETRADFEVILAHIPPSDLHRFFDAQENKPGFPGWLTFLGMEDPWLLASEREAVRPIQRRSPYAKRDYLATADLDWLAGAGAEGQSLSAGHLLAKVRRSRIKPKYKCCIISTVRNEGIYLLDWLAHHKALGVQEFFIYSNDNDDGSDDLLAELDRNGDITWLRNSASEGYSPQYKAYGHCFGLLPEVLEYAWVLVIDLDEYVVLDQKRFISLAEFLDWHHGMGSDAIALNWLLFGPNRQTVWRDAPVADRFTTRTKPEPTLIKSISRPQKISHSQCHFPWPNRLEPFRFVTALGEPHLGVPNTDIPLARTPTCLDQGAWINHYWFKSAEEFVWRRSNSAGDQGVATNALISNALATRFIVDFVEDWVPDDRILMYQAASARIAHRLRSNLAVSEAETVVKCNYRRSAMRKVELNLHSPDTTLNALARTAAHT